MNLRVVDAIHTAGSLKDLVLHWCRGLTSSEVSRVDRMIVRADSPSLGYRKGVPVHPRRAVGRTVNFIGQVHL